MNKPIEAGCLAEVISGLTGADSPNIGLIVRVVSLQGEHSQHGKIWRCKAEYAERGQPGVNVPPGYSDFAQSWLRRINEDKTKPKVKELENAKCT